MLWRLRTASFNMITGTDLNPAVRLILLNICFTTFSSQYFDVDDTFTFMHLADAFIQSDLHCIQVTVSTFYQLLLSLGIEPMILALLTPCSTSWATGKLICIKGWKVCHHLLTFMSFQTCVTYYLLWNTKEMFLKNVSVFVFPCEKLVHVSIL